MSTYVPISRPQPAREAARYVRPHERWSPKVLAAGAALAGAGVFLLVVTFGHARSEDDVEKSRELEDDVRREFGIMSGYMRQGLWAHRYTFQHPVLARAPGIVLLGTGIVLLGIAAAR